MVNYNKGVLSIVNNLNYTRPIVDRVQVLQVLKVAGGYTTNSSRLWELEGWWAVFGRRHEKQFEWRSYRIWNSIYFIVMIIDYIWRPWWRFTGDDGGGWWAVTHQIQDPLGLPGPDSSGGWWRWLSMAASVWWLVIIIYCSTDFSIQLGDSFARVHPLKIKTSLGNWF